MSAAVSSAPAFAFGSPSIDARLNLSLDDLIKERRKETKKEVKQHKKRENVKQEHTTSPKKADAQQKKKKVTAAAQTEKRKEKMNKNRGLPVAESLKQQQKKQNPNEGGSGKSAKKLQRKKAKKAAAQTNGHQVTSPKVKQQQQAFKQQGKNAKKSGNNSPSQKKAKQQQPKQQKYKAPAISPKQQAKKTMTFTVKAPKGARAVNKPAKGAKLQITLVRSDAELRRTKKQKQFEKQRQSVVAPTQKKKVNAKAVKALLPGKAQPKTRKVLAQNLVKQAKRSVSSKKQWTSTNGKFIVRKPVMVRKA